MSDDDRIARALAGEPFQPVFNPQTIGGFGTPSVAAALQMFDPRGLSPQQMDRNAAMRGPLLRSAYAANPELLLAPRGPEGVQGAERRSLGEDLNSVMIKYNNWRKQQLGQELTPGERVTQGFIDARNPNSWF